jgi:hypothetical protein
MSLSLRVVLGTVSVLVATHLSLATGLISWTGNCYSTSMPFREQTDALMDGRVALSTSPVDIEFDMAWTDTGVQQVWGLGVPLWRLPFEVTAAALAHRGFPDRILLVITVSLSAYLALRVLVVPPKCHCIGGWIESITANPVPLVSVLFVVAFPPIITMSRGKFDVHEEVLFYEYYYCMSLLGGTVALTRQPTACRYLLLTSCAGMIGFLRPTALAYGFATLCYAALVTRRLGTAIRVTGVCLFLTGISLLMLSNQRRFGHILEFGHRINVTGTDITYLSRFESPFDREPFWSAAGDVAGSVFFVQRLDSAAYDDNLISWQSPTVRSRFYYSTTFDVIFLAVLVATWGASAVTACSRAAKCGDDAPCALHVSAVWSLAAFVPLFVFYLRYCAICSLYVMDFAPAIAAAVVGLFPMLSCRWKSSRWIWPVGLAGVIGCWWLYEVATGKNISGRTPPVSWLQCVDTLRRASAMPVLMPNEYQPGNPPSDVTGIWANGAGWERESGDTRPIVVLFVNSPDQLTLIVERLEDTLHSTASFDSISVKVGLDRLVLATTQLDDRTCTLTFRRQHKASTRHGVEIAFISFATPETFRQHKSPFRLRRVLCSSESVKL